MAKPIAGNSKFIPTSEPDERIPVGVIPKAGRVQTDNQWDSVDGMTDISDSDLNKKKNQPARG